MIVVTWVAAALVVGACLVALPACSAIPAEPGVGTIDACDGIRLGGPPIEPAMCREVAETALRGYPGPQVLADGLQVSEVGCEILADRSAEAVANGTACWTVTGSGVSGGRRIRTGVFEGGRPVDIDGVVWQTADGVMHRSTNVTPTVLSP